MSRRHSAEKREVNPDPKFGNIIITKFMNSVMYDGKKSAAETIVYGALEMIETKTKQGPLPVVAGNLGPDRVDQRVVHDAVLLARPSCRAGSQIARSSSRRHGSRPAALLRRCRSCESARPARSRSVFRRESRADRPDGGRSESQKCLRGRAWRPWSSRQGRLRRSQCRCTAWARSRFGDAIIAPAMTNKPLADPVALRAICQDLGPIIPG